MMNTLNQQTDPARLTAAGFRLGRTMLGWLPNGHSSGQLTGVINHGTEIVDHERLDRLQLRQRCGRALVSCKRSTSTT
jgi:hypothetical protein